MFGGRPDADPAGDVLHQRRVVQDQPLAQRCVAGLLEVLPRARAALASAALFVRRGVVDRRRRRVGWRRPLPPRRARRQPPSGPGVRLVIRCPQPLDGHMGVDLRRRERSVTEQLLNASQVGSPLQQVGGSRVAQAVRAQVGRPGTCAQQARARPRGPSAGRPGRRARRGTAPARWPAPASARPAARPARRPRPRPAGTPSGTDRSLRALAEDPQHPAVPVDVVDVEPAQLADPDAGGVQQLEHGQVAQAGRRSSSSAASPATSAARRPRPAAARRAACGRCAGVASSAPGSVGEQARARAPRR